MPKTQLLTKEQIEKMKNEFLQLDLDNDGTITVDELGNCLRSMRVKLKLSEGEIKKTLKEIDKDGNGTIDLKEYMQNMKDKTNKDLIFRALCQRSFIRKEFHKFDADGSGFITRDELIEVIRSRIGMQLSTYQVDDLLKDNDENDDGKINYEEFVCLMMK